MPTETLDQVLTGQQLAPGINDNGEAMRAAALFGRRRSTCVGLTWGYYGGPTPVGYVPHGTVTLTANATNFIEADPDTYLPSVNTADFTAGSIPIRKVVTDANGPTSESSEVVLKFAGVGGGGGGGASYTLPTASASVLGGLKIGAGLAIDPATGIASATYSYTLPAASDSVLGGVKVGAGLAIDGSSVLSAPYSYTLPTASADTLGGVMVGAGLTITAGVLVAPYTYTLPTAAAGVLGGVRVGAGLSIDAGGALSAAGGTGKVALTQPATAATITVADGKTLTANSTLTLAGTDGTTQTMPPVTAELGYLGIPQNAKSAAYTLALADKGCHLYHPSADTTARIWTIPANASVAFPIGTALTFINGNAAGVITIAITTDVMRLAGAGTTGSRTLAANGNATALKVTATEWRISGAGLT